MLYYVLLHHLAYASDVWDHSILLESSVESARCMILAAIYLNLACKDVRSLYPTEILISSNMSRGSNVVPLHCTANFFDGI